MTDLGVRALGWIELLTTSNQALQFSLEDSELVLSPLNLEELGGEQFVDVGARRNTFAAQIENGTDFEQREPGPLPTANELELAEGCRVIGAVAAGVPLWSRKQATAFVKTQGLRGKPHL
jgi:hypothetical protein